MTKFYEGQPVIINCDAWLDRVQKYGVIRKITDQFCIVDSDDGEQRGLCFTHEGQGVAWEGSIYGMNKK